MENDRLTPHMAKFGYSSTWITTGLWKHESCPITLSLVVDDFGVKYVGRKHASHLLESLRQFYTLTEDWTGSFFIRMTIEWNYIEKCVDVSMPGYIPTMLHCFEQIIPVQCQYAPRTWTKHTYGAKKYAPKTDNSLVLSAPNTLYTECCCDYFILHIGH